MRSIVKALGQLHAQHYEFAATVNSFDFELAVLNGKIRDLQAHRMATDILSQHISNGISILDSDPVKGAERIASLPSIPVLPDSLELPNFTGTITAEMRARIARGPFQVWGVPDLGMALEAIGREAISTAMLRTEAERGLKAVRAWNEWFDKGYILLRQAAAYEECRVYIAEMHRCFFTNRLDVDWIRPPVPPYAPVAGAPPLPPLGASIRELTALMEAELAATMRIESVRTAGGAGATAEAMVADTASFYVTVARPAVLTGTAASFFHATAAAVAAAPAAPAAAASSSPSMGYRGR